MEKIRCRSLPDRSVFVFGWQRIFFHAVLGGMVEKQMGWPLVLDEWGCYGGPAVRVSWYRIDFIDGASWMLLECWGQVPKLA